MNAIDSTPAVNERSLRSRSVAFPGINRSTFVYDHPLGLLSDSSDRLG